MAFRRLEPGSGQRADDRTDNLPGFQPGQLFRAYCQQHGVRERVALPTSEQHGSAHAGSRNSALALERTVLIRAGKRHASFTTRPTTRSLLAPYAMRRAISCERWAT